MVWASEHRQLPAPASRDTGSGSLCSHVGSPAGGNPVDSPGRAQPPAGVHQGARHVRDTPDLPTLTRGPPGGL